jgi:hypothetical protein
MIELQPRDLGDVDLVAALPRGLLMTLAREERAQP